MHMERLNRLLNRLEELSCSILCWTNNGSLRCRLILSTSKADLCCSLSRHMYVEQVNAILPLNCMRLQTSRPVTALFLEASMFNHSCVSNVEVHTEIIPGGQGAEDWQAVFRATRDVEAGEELCLEYDCRKPDEDQKVFQQRLSDNYGFECTCAVCQPS